MCACGTGSPARGAALVIVMLIMAVLLLAGTTFLTISSTEMEIAINQRAAAQALFLADAGLQRAIARLNGDLAYAGESGVQLSGGQVSISVATASSQPCNPPGLAKDVIATGTVSVRGGQGVAQVRATVDKISYPFQWAAFAAVPNIAESTKELDLQGTLTIDSFDASLGQYSTVTNRSQAGHVGANGDVNMTAAVTVNGSVRAGSGISGGTVTGTRTSGAPAQEFPSVSLPAAPTPTGALTVGSNTTYAMPSGTYSYTSLTLGNQATIAPSGPVAIHVTGPVSIGNQARIETGATAPAIMYVTGSVTILNNASLASSGSLTIYATGAINLGNDVTIGSHPPSQIKIIVTGESVSLSTGNDLILYGGLFGKNANVELGPNSTVYGSLVARTVEVKTGAQLHFDQSLINQEVCGTQKYAVRRGTWREVIP